MKVIKYSNLPTGLPIANTLIAYLFMDKVGATQLAWALLGRYS